MPTAPAVYTWEATERGRRRRSTACPVEQILRFDLNTSPAPPDLVGRLLAANRFETTLSEYPPSDYRRLVIAAAADATASSASEILVGAGADEMLDMIAKAFLAPGLKAVVRDPDLLDVSRA